MSELTLSQWQFQARQQGVDRLDAQLMLCDVLGQNRTWLLAHDQDSLTHAQQSTLQSWLHRRAQGEPLAYILGRKEFFGLTLDVNPQVLIPRPDTEILVEWALELIPIDAPCRVLDLGTGSGAIALAIQHQRPQAHVTAVDASEGALQTAQANANKLGLPVRFRHGSWLEPVQGECFDVIVSNPPYIAEGDPHLPALTHEPITALTAGHDGLNDIRNIALDAQAHLTPSGRLLLEHGYDQASQIQAILRQFGYSDIQTRVDLGGNERCTGGQMKKSASHP